MSSYLEVVRLLIFQCSMSSRDLCLLLDMESSDEPAWSLFSCAIQSNQWNQWEVCAKMVSKSTTLHSARRLLLEKAVPWASRQQLQPLRLRHLSSHHQRGHLSIEPSRAIRQESCEISGFIDRRDTVKGSCQSSSPLAYGLFALSFLPYFQKTSGAGARIAAMHASSVMDQCTPIPSNIGRAAMTTPPVTK